jgi:hypothetical protein
MRMVRLNGRLYDFVLSRSPLFHDATFVVLQVLQGTDER